MCMAVKKQRVQFRLNSWMYWCIEPLESFWNLNFVFSYTYFRSFWIYIAPPCGVFEIIIICGSICYLTVWGHWRKSHNFLHFLISSFPHSLNSSFPHFLISSFPQFLISSIPSSFLIFHPAFRPTLVYQARPSFTLQKSERRSSRCY